jgi:hypothetical protein
MIGKAAGQWTLSKAISRHFLLRAPLHFLPSLSFSCSFEAYEFGNFPFHFFT